MSLRLAVVHYTAAPVAGGVESIVSQHARILAGRGHQVMLIAGRGDARIVPEIDSRYPRTEAVTAALAEGRVEPDYEALRADLEAALRPLLREVDVVLAHNVFTMPFNLPLTEALLGAGRPLIAWTHDLAWTDPRYRGFQRPGRPWDLMRTPQPGVLYVAISQTRRREMAGLLGLDPARIRMVPDGIDSLAFLGVGPAMLDLARRLGFAGPGPVVLVPARVTARKRLELAVEAAGAVRREHPDLRVVVSGPLGAHSPENVAYFDRLVDLRTRLGLDGTVVFIAEHSRGGEHPVSPEMVPQLYRLADAVLLPSDSEGFGLPVLEAGLGRTPMVCADIATLREVGGDHLHRFPVAGGAGDLAAALLEALATSPARLRRRVIERYDWGVVAETMEAVIEEARG